MIRGKAASRKAKDFANLFAEVQGGYCGSEFPR